MYHLAERKEYNLTKKLTLKQLVNCADWISKTKELPNISSSKEMNLSSKELEYWFDSALQGITIQLKGEIIGIATASVQEADLPERMFELCHCIVKPEYRLLYNGSVMLEKLCEYAKENGFSQVVGRVEKSNNLGKKLLNSLNFYVAKKNFSHQDSIIWYQKKL
ncbi:MAG: GNAT family N-acetyltransferase [Oligoflexia bacterium]|nr:GNAT family N-acetyltransferase [Oligoflexia bacterium]